MKIYDIPFLEYTKIIGPVWSTIQWKRLNRGDYKSMSQWLCSKFEISEEESKGLREFDPSIIEKYQYFGKELKEIYNGDFVDIINYDEGCVYIAIHKDIERKYKMLRPKIKRPETRRTIVRQDPMKRVQIMLELYPFLNEELVRLYNLGLNDRFLSKKIRTKFPEITFNVTNVLYWRKMNNLLANKTVGYVCKIDKKIEDEILSFYNQKLSDLEIGIAMGLNPGKIADWRFRNNLKVNRKRIPVETSVILTSDRYEEFMQM